MKRPKASEDSEKSWKKSKKSRERRRDDTHKEEEEDPVSLDVMGEDAEPDPELGASVVNVEFCFFPPSEIDFHSLKGFASNLLDGAAWNPSTFTDFLCGQTHIGTVIKTSDDNDTALGITTCLPIRQIPDDAPGAFQPLRDFLLARCPDPTIKKELSKTVLDPTVSKTGLLITDRVLNTPDPVGAALLEALVTDMNNAVEDDDLDPKERQVWQEQTSYLLFSRAYRSPEEPIPTSGVPESIACCRIEDTYLLREAKWSFAFGVANAAVNKNEMQPIRIVALLDKKGLTKALAKLKKDNETAA